MNLPPPVPRFSCDHHVPGPLDRAVICSLRCHFRSNAGLVRAAGVATGGIADLRLGCRRDGMVYRAVIAISFIHNYERTPLAWYALSARRCLAKTSALSGILVGAVLALSGQTAMAAEDDREVG